MRGEHSTSSTASQPPEGSSPHARGAPRGAPRRSSRGADHPRMRGEHRARPRHRRHEVRIIPACAGSTTGAKAPSSPAGDHPRMRGEHSLWSHTLPFVLGSSPHARGARHGERRDFRRRGIIPACAGSTLRSRTRPQESRDHPRMRGEHPLSARRRPRDRGSSPHARGALLRRQAVHDLYGIIPACAGSTRPRPAHTPSAGDHPRMRGEHNSSRTESPTSTGSSPHARGARCPRWSGGSRLGDHPRMRGEHPEFVPDGFTHRGSSPHARGALPLPRQRHLRVGIIPACAGSTLENQRQSLVYAYDSLTFARMQFDRGITESRKSRSAFLRTASPFGTCSHRSTPSKGGPQGWRHRFRWAEV